MFIKLCDCHIWPLPHQLHHSKETWTHELLFLTPLLPPSPCKQKHPFCLHGFTCCGHFVSLGSDSILSFVFTSLGWIFSYMVYFDRGGEYEMHFLVTRSKSKRLHKGKSFRFDDGFGSRNKREKWNLQML